MWFIPVWLHHEGIADPDLLQWLRDRLGDLVGLGPLALVMILGVVIVVIPAATLVIYATQRSRLK